ncbi:hypothetical protein N7454_004861 [Penicillium verhagenii]|nr:hypothetical protein N7454_004861 [Penicillium verhagenii]
MYYHRFRLTHPDNEYNFMIFDINARGILGLERLMLEAAGFDFRTRHPHKTLTKIARRHGLPKEIWSLAHRISLDLYRTFAPLKQSTPCLALASLELASRLLGQRIGALESQEEYERWNTNREQVMETLFDLLELYTHHRASTSVGPIFPADQFLTVRIPLNQEARETNIPRFAFWVDQPRGQRPSSGGERSPGSSQRPLHPLIPVAASGERHRADKGREAAVRFMLDPAQAESEKRQVEPYFRVETEQYEVTE